MTLEDKERILKQFEAKMLLESLKSEDLFSCHGKYDDVRASLAKDLSAQVRQKLRNYISPADGEDFVWKLGGRNRHFHYVRNGRQHDMYYDFDSCSAMGIHVDAQLVDTACIDYANTPGIEIELYVEMWLLQRLKDNSIESMER